MSGRRKQPSSAGFEKALEIMQERKELEKQSVLCVCLHGSVRHIGGHQNCLDCSCAEFQVAEISQDGQSLSVRRRLDHIAKVMDGVG